MPKLYVQFRGSKQPQVISVVKVDDDGQVLVLKNGKGEMIGSIEKAEVAGWWLEDDSSVSSF